MPSTSVIPFTFESHEVRVIEREGSPWWVLKDICAVLEVGKYRDAAVRLDEDERGLAVVDTRGGPQSVTVINESGLWSLVLTSRKPQAKTFKKWLTSVVIPTLRKDGAYIVGEEKISTAQNLSELEAVQELVDFTAGAQGVTAGDTAGGSRGQDRGSGSQSAISNLAPIPDRDAAGYSH